MLDPRRRRHQVSDARQMKEKNERMYTTLRQNMRDEEEDSVAQSSVASQGERNSRLEGIMDEGNMWR